MDRTPSPRAVVARIVAELTVRAATAAIGAVLLAGCGTPAEPAPSPPPASHLTQAPPNEVSGLQIPDGRIDEAVSKVDGLVDELMKDTGIPGMAMAVVHRGKTVYAKGFGVTDVRTGDKVGTDTVFQLASVSKSVGATVVAHEVTQNVISWDTPVVAKLSWFALSDPYVTRHVTIADLYSHRSGLPTTPVTSWRISVTTVNRCCIG